MSVSSGSDVTIPIQDSPPPPPSPYANQKSGSKRGMSKTPEPRGDVGFENNAFQSTENQTNSHKSLNETISSAPQKTQTEIQMTGNGPNQAVNAELINMNVLDTIPQKPQTEFGPYENFDEYFISVNQHKKFLRRGEKLYVTKDKRKTSKCKKYVCWVIGAFILAAIVTVAVLAGVGLIPHKSPTTLSMIETTTTGKSTDGTISPSGQTEFTSERQQSTTAISDESTVSPDPTLDGTSSSTTQAPVAVDTRVPSAADIQLILDNGVYNDSLRNPLSPSYVKLASELELLLKRTMEEDFQLNTAFARVLDFSEGSIVAKVRLGWIDDYKKSEDLQRLVSTLRKLGDYDVRPGTTFYSVFNFCKLSNNGCSNYCTFDYESLDFLCTCPEHLVLAEDKKTCHEISSSYPSSFQNVTSSESPLEIEPSASIPTKNPPDVSEESDAVPATDSPAPEETSQPQEIIPISSSSTSSTTMSPIPEDASTNATSSETMDGTDSSEKQNSTITVDDMIFPSPEILSNTSESSNMSGDESSAPSTIMPDVDYNVELSPELSSPHADNTSEKFEQITATEPTITMHTPENETSMAEPDADQILPNTDHHSNDDVTSTTTTTTAVPPIVREQNTENPIDVPELANQEAQIQSEYPSSTTTTTTEHPPIVENTAANATENHTHIIPELQADLSAEVENIFHNASTTELESNRTSRLIMKSQRSDNFEMGNSASEETLESESAEEGPRREEFQEQNQHPTAESIANFDAEHNPLNTVPVLTTISPDPTSTNVSLYIAPNKTAPNTGRDPEFPIFSGETEEREREALQETETESPDNQTVTENHSESKVEEIEVSPTVLPPRPVIPGSDEFMAFSDANMRIVNENLKKVNASLEPSSASAETSSYEVVSGDESDISHSNSNSDENNPSAFLVDQREIEEVTTIQPISLINDTAVNDLTENVTEDLMNSENIFQVSEETVPVPAVTESSGSREAEHGAGEGIRDIIVELVTSTMAPTTTTTTTLETTTMTTTSTTITPEFHIIHSHDHVEFPEQVPIEMPKPQNPESATQEKESHAFDSQEIGITTTTGRSIGGGHESAGFSTTIPILPHIHSGEAGVSAITTTNRPEPEPSSKNSSKIHISVDNENELH